MVRMLGADAALAVPDTRAERTVNQVISPQAYDMLFQRCARRAVASSALLAGVEAMRRQRLANLT